MKIIGLCGGSGSGKGAVCQIFQENGILTIDTDAVYRDLTSKPGKLLDALAREFGREIITEDKILNRKALADIVFSSENASLKLKKLNTIAHKHILDETRAILKYYSADGHKLGVVDAPVLFESGFDAECDFIVAVVAKKETRLQRIMSRDAITREEAERRIASQMSDKDIISKSDYVIYNDSHLISLKEQVVRLIEQLK